VDFVFEDLAKCIELALFHTVAMVIVRIYPGGDLGSILFKGFETGLSDLAKGLSKFRFRAVGQAEDVRSNEDLSVAAGT